MKKNVLFILSSLLLVGCNSGDSISNVSIENSISENNSIPTSINSDVTNSSTSSNKEETVEVSKKPTRNVKVYLNPSVQTWNSYANNLGTEAEHMNNIANYMVKELEKYEYIDLKVNSSYLPLKESVKESNTFNTDIHFALHSNAGGGKGLEILTINSKKFSNTMYEGFFELGNFNRRGIKDGSSIYEIKNSKAKDVALIELLFHDNVEEAKFIVNNEKAIAKNLTNSLVNYIIENY
ncbi:MAG: N-acetylmuramoyl-L-alanine amidase [Erysipelotrichales bacterium]|nr:N-acetylmuramoyl-L-alanine amidase [Erysipelotrichales bacterium]